MGGSDKARLLISFSHVSGARVTDAAGAVAALDACRLAHSNHVYRTARHDLYSAALVMRRPKACAHVELRQVRCALSSVRLTGA